MTNKRAYYRAEDGDWCDHYDMLKGPDDFECLLTEPEDRNWYRDGREVVTRLNEQHDEIATLTARLAEAEALLDSRAGKLLRKGKTFIVVAVDESYFQGTYAAIRYTEIEKGRWSEEDELRYREACKEWIVAAKGGRDDRLCEATE